MSKEESEALRKEVAALKAALEAERGRNGFNRIKVLERQVVELNRLLSARTCPYGCENCAEIEQNARLVEQYRDREDELDRLLS